MLKESIWTKIDDTEIISKLDTDFIEKEFAKVSCGPVITGGSSKSGVPAKLTVLSGDRNKNLGIALMKMKSTGFRKYHKFIRRINSLIVDEL